MKLAEVRRLFAREMLAIAGVTGNERLENAFARVPREKFLGHGRWHILTPWSHQNVDEQDPAVVYQDVVIALDEERGVNNGSPSLHAHWLDVVAPRPGDRVAHIGAGTGYYSAILSELVGPDGRVTAVEYDSGCAERARENLSSRRNVDVVHANGCFWPEKKSDVVYVNFAIPRPADPWIENLKPGGRMIFPLGIPNSTRSHGRSLNGVGIAATRLEKGYAASSAWPVSFVFAEGLTPEPGNDEIRNLYRSLRNGGWDDVKSLVWKQPVDSANCWYVGPDWSLSYSAVAP
ncbi:protein-L-isoaspartate O-methyltransferase [Hyphomicrobium sp. 99]|uniref:protein-L-isoaspartate O-methyltransferase family protein n=1 Tax=Hyphomicrobium sp. 99 TaxID=1163419 RepID=UPI0005F7F0D1|nr:methyltransferase domain-containing protein [Hyphomicrobium sp. 99]